MRLLFDAVVRVSNRGFHGYSRFPGIHGCERSVHVCPADHHPRCRSAQMGLFAVVCRRRRAGLRCLRSPPRGGLHALVFAAIPNLPSKPMLYTIYAALAAGVCEELGRVCGFAVLQASDRRPDGVGRALGAGIGHGGIEAILLVGVATISHLVISVSVINAGTSEAFLAGLPDASAISWPASSNCSSIRLRRSTC